MTELVTFRENVPLFPGLKLHEQKGGLRNYRRGRGDKCISKNRDTVLDL